MEGMHIIYLHTYISGCVYVYFGGHAYIMLFIMAEKARARGGYVKRGVGLVRDKEVTLEDGEVSHN